MASGGFLMFLGVPPWFPFFRLSASEQASLRYGSLMLLASDGLPSLDSPRGAGHSWWPTNLPNSSASKINQHQDTSGNIACGLPFSSILQVKHCHHYWPHFTSGHEYLLQGGGYRVRLVDQPRWYVCHAMVVLVDAGMHWCQDH